MPTQTSKDSPPFPQHKTPMASLSSSAVVYCISRQALSVRHDLSAADFWSFHPVSFFMSSFLSAPGWPHDDTQLSTYPPSRHSWTGHHVLFVQWNLWIRTFLPPGESQISWKDEGQAILANEVHVLTYVLCESKPCNSQEAETGTCQGVCSQPELRSETLSSPKYTIPVVCSKKRLWNLVNSYSFLENST